MTGQSPFPLGTLFVSYFAEPLPLDLGLSDALCRCTLDFLMGRPQVVKADRNNSSSLTLSTGAPQGCVLSPLLYSLYTQDRVATADSNTIIKFADDSVVVGFIHDNDDTT